MQLRNSNKFINNNGSIKHKATNCDANSSL